jgi:hypothetical protein
MDETGDHNVKQNETAKERQESHALIHLWNLDQMNEWMNK